MLVGMLTLTLCLRLDALIRPGVLYGDCSLVCQRCTACCQTT
jgi:hypothetical protein